MAGIYKDEHITEEFTAELREMFSLYDHGDGIIDIRGLLVSLDKHISEEEIEETIREFTKEGEVKMCFEDFQMYLLKKMKDIESTEDVKGMFMALDITDSGDFTAGELRAAISFYGETITLEEAEDLIQSIPTELPGRINYDEFCRLVKMIIGRR